MKHYKRSSIITAIAALGFWVAAGLHLSAYPKLVTLAAHGPDRLQHLAPMLWLGIGFDFVVAGLIVGAVALWPTGPARIVLVFAALQPLAAAALQIHFVGFIPPTSILIVVGVLTLSAAVLSSTRPSSAGFAP